MDIATIKTLEEGHGEDRTPSKSKNFGSFLGLNHSARMTVLYQNQCVLFEMLKDIHCLLSDPEGSGY